MDQEIASAINGALFHQKAPAHIRIINAKRHAKGAIYAITHPNATSEMPLQCRNIIITAARTVDKGVVDVEENQSCERLMIHTVPLIRYMGKGTEGLQKMREKFEAQNEGIVIPTQRMVAWEPPYHQGEEAERRNCSVSGSHRRKGEQGGTDLSQERYQGGGGVVPSRNVHERGT